LSPPAQRALAVASAAERTERGGHGRALVITEEGSAQAQRSEAEAMETEEHILEQQELPTRRRSSRVQAQTQQAPAGQSSAPP
jgi:hypothetical protein